MELPNFDRISEELEASGFGVPSSESAAPEFLLRIPAQRLPMD